MSTALLIVGNAGGTNVGQSFQRAAHALGISHQLLDQTAATRGNRILQALSWRVLQRRPWRLGTFSAAVLSAVQSLRPPILLSTGHAPINAQTLHKIRALGTICVNYSTDDPFNAAMRSRFFTRALSGYQVIFTPRQNNVEDLRAHVDQVHWLPFGFDPSLFFPECLDAAQLACLHEPVLFVGGGDQDRARYLTPLASAGLGLAVFGSEFERYAQIRACLRGRLDPDELRQRTIAASICVILIRKANRDQHVMRSLEAAACGGCLLVEDTAEHRLLLSDGAHYFSSPTDLVVQARRLLDNPSLRAKLRQRALEVTAAARYQDRLAELLNQLDVAGLTADKRGAPSSLHCSSLD
jgi:spore maturation protein CgeB